ncbi:MAG TPA: GTPase HflX [Cyclobacteriaceae bacterium]
MVKEKKERCILVALTSREVHARQERDHLDELSFLSSTLGMEAIRSFTQKSESPDPKTFVGKGKLQEIKEYAIVNHVSTLVFDDELSPSQFRNIEKEFGKLSVDDDGIKIYDRSLLILDIFLKRAKTAQAKMQVELARYEYLLPRLTRMWTHLERQRGGTGTRGGAGEKEIETDRRIIRDQISLLKKKLQKIDKQSQVRRKSRSNIVRISLVGYTNAGKSTIMKLLSKSDAYARDELFATVDSKVRRVTIKNIPFLLSDTVGFIRKLPHNLIESFKSTLDEVSEADILLHVIDVSNPAYEDHIEVVESTLTEINAADIPIIRVYNKIDKLEQQIAEKKINGEIVEEIEGLQYGVDRQSWRDDIIFISAVNKTNIQALKELIYNKVAKKHHTIYPNFLKKEIH